MSTQIPKGGSSWDSCRDVDPVEVPQLISGSSLGADSKAFLGGNGCTNAVEIRESGGVGSLEDLLVVGPGSNHHQVIS